jgi:hypothetical protein
VPPSRKDLKKAQLFKEVLLSIDPTAEDQPPDPGKKGNPPES